MQNDTTTVAHPQVEVEVTPLVSAELDLIGGGQAVVNTV